MTDYTPIRFLDIRKSDTIRHEFTSKGRTYVVEGMAWYQDDCGNWYTEDRGRLICPLDGGDLYLVSRPNSVPTKPGSVLTEATLKNGQVVGPLILDRDGWIAFQDNVSGWLHPDKIASFTRGKIVDDD